MLASDAPLFSTTDEEARYYRTLSKELQDELEDLKAALSDFQSSSKELEDEMERELENTERRETELRLETERLRSDLESWKGRHQDTLKEHSKTMQHMQQELEHLRTSEKSLRSKLRDIELDNDDLEKNERAISSTLSDVESRYNKAIERTALLEQELVDKVRLEEELQRTKDELRENIEELAVLDSAREEAVANATSAMARVRELESRTGLSTSTASCVMDSTGVRTQKIHNITEDSSLKFTVPDANTANETVLTSHASSTRPLSHQPRMSGTFKGIKAVPGTVTSNTMHDAAAEDIHKSSTPVTSRQRKSEGIISDMRDLTLRMQTMSKSLNTRRESSMAGSAIPRPTPQKTPVNLPTSALGGPLTPESLSWSNMGVQSHTTATPRTGRPSTSLSAGRPASELRNGLHRTTPSDRERSSLKCSRPASRTSAGDGKRLPQTPSIARPSTPSQSAGIRSAAKPFRRSSLGPSCSKKGLQMLDGTHVPPIPLPITPTNNNAEKTSKRISLTSSVQRPVTTGNQPAWR